LILLKKIADKIIFVTHPTEVAEANG
jgi:hypothetical protein